MKSLLFFSLFMLAAYIAPAQKDAGVVRSDKPITWLGMDFSQARFIGSAMQFKDAGEVTTDQIRDKYIPGWNELFINEQKKYDVAKYVHRESVAFALDVTTRSNNKVGSNFFSNDPADYNRLTQADIEKKVKSYDFMGNKGVGLIFFVEAMSKGKDEAAAWITFVDMGTKKVLETRRVTGKAGGFGFRNYWAKAFLNILKDTDSRG
jgi:hypothetical protein